MERINKTFSIVEAAEFIGCSESMIRKLVRNHKIKYYRVGNRIRFSDLELQYFIKKQELIK